MGRARRRAGEAKLLAGMMQENFNDWLAGLISWEEFLEAQIILLDAARTGGLLREEGPCA